MAHSRVSENPVRLCLTALMALVVLAWGVSGFNSPTLEHQLDEQGSFQPAMLDACGDSPSGESGMAASHDPQLYLVSSRPVHSENLSFIEPADRLVSYPGLPQGPPSLT